jgi:hypothetical protein
MYQRVYVPFSEDTLSAFARSQAVPAIQPLLAAFPVGNAGPTSSPYFDRVQKTLASSVKCADQHRRGSAVRRDGYRYAEGSRVDSDHAGDSENGIRIHLHRQPVLDSREA